MQASPYPHRRALLTAIALVAMLVTSAINGVRAVQAVSPNVVISQVYGGGGNAGATYTHDYVELFNRGTTPVDLTGWSLQYASATGTGNFGANTGQLTELSGTLGAGQYLLVQEASGANGSPLPIPADTVDATPINLSGSAGKVALANIATTLGCNGGSTACSPAALANIVDLVGYGTANFFEGAAAPGLSNTTAAVRAANGCTDTDNNASDFAASAPAPRNTASPLNPCVTSTNPTGTGAANPNSVAPGGTTLLTVEVVAGTNPASTGLTVTADLTSIGGSATQALTDDALNGDVTAGDNIFSYQATVDGATAPGAKSLPVSISDAELRNGSASIELTVATPVTGAEVVISEVYGGGGNAGATFTNDFIELYNRTAAPIDLTGWSVQYASSAGTSWTATNLSGVIPAGGNYLVQEAAGAGGTTPLPAPDATGNIAMSGTAGKVALVSTTTALTGGCPTGAPIVDLVGYGAAATCFEGAGAAPGLSNTTSAQRLSGGAQDTDNNTADFVTGAPDPDNSGIDLAPTVASTSPTAGESGVAADANVTVNFSEAVNVTDPWFTLACTVSGAHTAVVSGGPTSFTLNPDSDFAFGESCTVTVTAAQVSDQDAVDPPDTLAVDYVFNFTTAALPFGICGDPATLIHAIQGSGAASPMNGATNVIIEGVVVGDFQAAGELNGFYVQEQDADADTDPATSEGIFVFNTSFAVSPGDLVRLKANVTEFNGLTEMTNVSELLLCGSSSVTITEVNLPFASSAAPEQYEGMLVRFPQTLVISEYFNYDQFGEIVLALPLPGEDRAFTPTAIDEPGAAALARAQANSLRRITLDDNRGGSNPTVLRHPNGDPFSLTNRFRGGDTVQNTVGVLSFSFNLYRVQPTAPADYTAVNPRTAAPEDVGGELRVAAMNTLNYFLTLDYPTGNPADNKCSPSQTLECRGADADQPDEFSRQRTKLLQALAGLDADVIGLNELENTPGVDPVGDIVAGLNDLLGAGTYAAIDTGVIGTDAIRVGLIYKPAKVTPVGSFDTLTTAEDPRFLDTKSRPPLAQTFETVADHERFTIVVNHLKSKGSACTDVGDPDAGDGQGNCNGTRTAAAEAIVDWLATDPTGSGDPDFLIMGDLNSYAQEDPIDAILEGADDTPGTADDYTNLIALHQGLYAYSYVFDGQAGYLDHALASASLVGQVTAAADWHINADEPDVVDYDTTFKPAEQEALYEPNGYRASDHDPVVVGLTFNTAPSVDAGGPYSVVEGGSVQVSATGSDPNDDALTYAWDLDNNGSYETPGQTATFSAASLQAPGTYTIAVQVTDPDGATATDTATVNVIFNFTGFFSPIANPPALNQRKAGAAAPVKFSLGGNQGLNILAAGYPQSVPINCTTLAPTGPGVPTNANGGLTYSGGQYSYVWKTEEAWAGTCRQLVVVLTDGTTHVANFKFK